MEEEINENIEFNTRCTKQTYYDAFINEYPDYRTYKLSQKRFTQWLEQYCKFYKHEYLSGNSNGQRWFEIINKGIEKEDDNDIVF